MAKVLVLYYSAYGHIEKMAEAVAEGARAVPGAQVTIKRVPELVPDDVAKKSGLKLDQRAPIAKPDELGDYDAVIFGTPTRFGNMAAQMRNFLDQTGSLWMKGALVGKVVAVSKTRSTVLRLDDPQFGVAVQLLQPDVVGPTGFARGQRSSTLLSLSTIDSTETLTKGELAVTRGTANSLFPKGLAVGTVTRNVSAATATQQQAQLKPIADLDRLDLVKVLRYSPAPVP